MDTEKYNIVSEDFSPNRADVAALFETLNRECSEFKSHYEDLLCEVGHGWSVKCVEDFGGEGEGDTAWAIIRLVSPDGQETFWKIPAYYASSYGFDWDISGTYQVKPYEKVVQSWRKIG